MPAYAIFDLKVFDQEKLKEYKNVAPEILKKFGGKVIISGGEANSVEGNWNQKRVVVIEFPSYEIANEWWNSDEYKKATELRKKAVDSNVLIINGI